jgi:phosphoglycolate phosphatase
MSADTMHAAFPASPVRAVIVDLDGTMVDTLDDFVAALNGMLAHLGEAAVDRDEISRYVGKGSEHLVREVLGARWPAARVEAAMAAALARYQAEYGACNGRQSRVYPGVAPGLAALRGAGIALACVTNKPERFARALLTRHGLDAYFTVVYGGDTWPRRKPDPLPMLKACEALGVAPAEAVAIGDSENDAHAARAGGIGSLTVPYGYNHGRPVQTIPTDGIVETLLDAARTIQSRR